MSLEGQPSRSSDGGDFGTAPNASTHDGDTGVDQELYFLIQRFLSIGPCRNAAKALRTDIEEHRLLPRRKDVQGKSHLVAFEAYVNANKHVSPNHLKLAMQRLVELLNEKVPPCVINVKTSLLGAGRQSIVRKAATNQTIHCSEREFLLNKRIPSTNPPRTSAALGEIAILDVNYENTLLAAGSNDRTVRVWSIQTGATVAVLQAHTAVLTMCHFLPLVYHNLRCLVSTSNDGSVCFWGWDIVTKEFDPKPCQYLERSKPGVQMISMTHSPAGRFVVCGSTDCYVRIYEVKLGSGTPERILEEVGHKDKVDSMEWSHSGLKFITGSRDGTAKIWKYKNGRWRTLELVMAHQDEQQVSSASDSTSAAQNSSKPLKVLMVQWSQNDEFAITSVSDNTIRLFDPEVGTCSRILKLHTDDCFCLASTQLCPDLVLTAAHDGFLTLFNVFTGEVLKRHFNEQPGYGHGCFFDCSFSPDGTVIAATDNAGYLSILSCDSGDPDLLKSLPKEQFFHTDFRPVRRDQRNFVVDEQTQVAPHLMPPPFLVDSEGNPYSAQTQRQVPGREMCLDTYLVPEYIVGTDDESQVVDVEVSDDNEASRQSGNSDGRSTPSRQLPLCTWVNRNIVPPLDPSTLSYQTEKFQELLWHESEMYEQEKKSKPTTGDEYSEQEPSMSAAIEQNVEEGSSNKHKYGTRGKKLSDGRAYRTDETSATERQTSASETEPELDEEGRVLIPNGPPRLFLNEEAEAEDDDGLSGDDLYDISDESDFDWEENIQRSPNRRRHQRDDARHSTPLESESDIGSDSEQPSTSSGQSSSSKITRPRRRATKSKSRTYDHRESEQSSASSPSRPRKRSSGHHKKSRPKATNAKFTSHEELTATFDTVPDSLKFPDWLTSAIPKKFPYFPQVLDQVAYFWQGHKLYLKAVEERGLYQLGDYKPPWHYFPELGVVEYCEVCGVEWIIVEKERVCCLRLRFLNDQAGSKEFRVRFHDIPHVVDFMILKHHYDRSVKRKCSIGDPVVSVIDDCWWFGRLTDKKPLDPQFPHSPFLSLQVLWDSGEPEALAPWDLEDMPNGRSRTSKPKDSTHLTVEEYRTLNTYEFTERDAWPSLGVEAEIRRIVTGIDKIMTHSLAEQFLVPVDLNAYPQYMAVIAFPTSLSTIRERIQNRFYRRKAALLDEIKYLAKNAEIFNEPRSEIVRRAKRLSHILETYIKSERCSDIEMIINDNTRIERNRGKSSNSTSADEGSPSKPERSWQEWCQDILDQIWRSPEAIMFHDRNGPQCAEFYEDFEDVLDLLTIRQKLNSGEYASPESFSSEVLSISNAAKTHSSNPRSKTHQHALKLQCQFKDKFQKFFDDWNGSKHGDSRALMRHKYETRRHPAPQLRPSVSYVGRTSRTNADLANGSSCRGEQRAPDRAKRAAALHARAALNDIAVEAMDSFDSPDRPSTSAAGVPGSQSAAFRRPTSSRRKREAREEEYVSESEEEEEESGTPPRLTKRHTYPVDHTRTNNRPRTRFAGKRSSTFYADSSSDEENDFVQTMSTSSRGRVRKLRRMDL